MTMPSIILKRGKLKLTSLVRPITIWWSDEQIEFWAKNHYHLLGNEYPRIQTTPYSIVEFPFDEFESLEMTDESAAINSYLVKESTLYYKWSIHNMLPIPNGGMAGFYEYPITLLGLQTPINPEAKFFDFSGYVNYQFLKEDKVSFVDFITKESNCYPSKFEEEYFSIAEYSNFYIKQT